MYAIRMLPGLPNLGRKVSGQSLLISVNYATKRVSLEEKLLGFPERPKKPLSPYAHYCQQKFAEYSNVYPKIPSKEIFPKCAEQWNLIDKETKSKLSNEYHEKLKKYSEALEQYNHSLTDAQRLHLETLKKDGNESKQKKQLRLEQIKTGKPTRPANPFVMFVKEVFSKMTTADSGKPSEPVNLKEIGKRWSSLTPEEKAPYKLRFDAADQEYQTKLAKWKEEMVLKKAQKEEEKKDRNLSIPIPAVDESEKMPKKTKSIKPTTERK